MQIEHKQLVENGSTVIYINVYTEDNYEFGKDALGGDTITGSVKGKLIDYIKKNIKFIQGAIIVVAINGILVGALTMDKPTDTNEKISNLQIEQASEEKNNTSDVKKTQNETKSETTQEKVELGKTEKKDEKKQPQTSTNSSKPAVSGTNTASVSKGSNTNTSKPKVTSTNKTTTTNTNTGASANKNTASTNTVVPSKTEEKDKVTETPQKTGYYIKLNNKGTVQSIELEEYVIGVVAAEMPASFNIEALKAQAIAARTYAVKKSSQGKVLVNSTADQVYKTTTQMKSTWGSDYSFYYNKIKNAVNATKGMVLKYNGEFIDAQYSAMSNGKTELPEYVWSFSRPYLQCVSSSWDKKVKNFEVTKTFSYEQMSSALGQTITPDTNIEVLTRTVSDRIDKIKIGDRTYTGVEVRSKLGLRSTDFTITLKDKIEITTRGFGHGVGMSQYGANVAANEGYSYLQILNHYYVGASIGKV